jgi:Kdo2-lipid IVA lauroyltransferase/acyltransferase
VITRLPRRSRAWLGRRLGDGAYIVLAARRRMALTNIESAIPDLAPADRRRVCRGSFQHLGLMLVEFASLLTQPPKRSLEGIVLEGLDHLQKTMAIHGRALVLSAHLGNWEFLALSHRLMGFPATVVVRPLDAPGLDTLAERLRSRAGVELIDKRGALRPVLGALRRGRLVALLLDQNASRREGIFASFFGRPASTPKSLAVLALRTRTPVVPMFIYRTGIERHRVVIHPPLFVEDAPDAELAVADLTQRCTTAIEAAIRVAPDQWMWIHNRWRTQPLAPVAPSGT